ncbi:MAG: hypothetical protein GC136_05655 [Alphaproteobacteria bacterium]|nr:hypothetical protein [Alphaproteobacteria bacterium]
MSLLKLRPSTAIRALSIPFFAASAYLLLQDAPDTPAPPTATITEQAVSAFERSTTPLGIVSLIAGGTLMGVSLRRGGRKAKKAAPKPK